MSKPWSAILALAACTGLTIGPARAVTTTTLAVDFEAPLFTPGQVTNNQYATGQGGWGGWNAIAVGPSLVWPLITSARAHSGTQSMLTTRDTRVISKALVDSGPDYPNNASPFNINAANPWWVQAWVYLNPGARAFLTLHNGLGACPQIVLSAANVPTVNSCLSQSPVEASLGAGAHGQWLFLQMVHADPTNQSVQFSITGSGIDYRRTLLSYSGPGSGAPNFLGVSGDAYWDDIRAGYGTAPAPVPEPSALLLMVAGLAVLCARHRRRS